MELGFELEVQLNPNSWPFLKYFPKYHKTKFFLDIFPFTHMPVSNPFRSSILQRIIWMYPGNKSGLVGLYQILRGPNDTVTEQNSK